MKILVVTFDFKLNYGNLGFLNSKRYNDMEFLHDAMGLQLRKFISETKIQKLLSN